VSYIKRPSVTKGGWLGVTAVVAGAATATALAVFPPGLTGAASASIPAGPVSVPVDPGHSLHVKTEISELPVPPTANADGTCPAGAADCVSSAWGALGSPGFYWDAHYVLLGVNYALGSGHPGPQILLEKTDGTHFADGNSWKCLTCGVALPTDPTTNKPAVALATYPPPHALPGDTAALVGNGILKCSDSATGVALQLSDDRCTPSNTTVYPIYWGGSPLGATSRSAPLGNGREWRLSPDGVHLAWDSLTISASGIGESEFEGTLSFDSLNNRYDVTDVYFLAQGSPWTVTGSQLQFTPHAMIGELRGWSSDGQSILGIQSYESDSIDAWATSLASGQSTPLTYHAEYTDPMFESPNGKYLLAEEVAGSGRLDFISGMEGIPPLTDLLGTAYVSSIRNNQNRRFFRPWLVDPARQQSEQINAGADPSWNAAADPVWLADSTAVVWVENYACAANAPVASNCVSSEPGGRYSRVMIARFPTMPPDQAVPPAPISDTAPANWAKPYTGPSSIPAAQADIPTGTYTLTGKVRGYASVVIDSTASAVQSVQVTYHNYSLDGRHTINGTESTQPSSSGGVTWHEDLVLSGQETGTKLTSEPGGFTLPFYQTVVENLFGPTGSMTTTIDGQTYTQPPAGS
jgi:hypothetical protein